MEPEKLKLIEEYAGLFFTIEEIAILIEIDYDKFKIKLREKQSDVYRAYMRGKLNSIMAIRKNQLLLARNGSPKAEEAVEKLIKTQNISETEI